MLFFSGKALQLVIHSTTRFAGSVLLEAACPRAQPYGPHHSVKNGHARSAGFVYGLGRIFGK